MRRHNIMAGVFAITLAIGLSACSTINSMVSSVESAFTSSSVDSNTVAYLAGKLYAIAANTTKAVVESNTLTSDQLDTLETDRAAVRTALDAMVTAMEAGDDVDTAAFTAAWKTFESYLSTLGITLTSSVNAPYLVATNDARSQLVTAQRADSALAGAISKTARAMK